MLVESMSNRTLFFLLRGRGFDRLDAYSNFIGLGMCLVILVYLRDRMACAMPLVMMLVSL